MDTINAILAALGGLATGGAGAWLAFKNAKVQNAQADTNIVATEAECSVIQMLREEVERMNVSNAKLGIALGEFQLENLALRKEISELHDTINQLTERLNSLQRGADLLQPNTG